MATLAKSAAPLPPMDSTEHDPSPIDQWLEVLAASADDLHALIDILFSRLGKVSCANAPARPDVAPPSIQTLSPLGSFLVGLDSRIVAARDRLVNAIDCLEI